MWRSLARAVWLRPGTVHSIRMMSAVKMRNFYLHERDVQRLSKHSDVFEINGLLRELTTTIAEHGLECDSEYLQTAYHFAALAHAARSLGYRPGSFSDMFRREPGMAPSDFRPDETLRDAVEDSDAPAAN
ncbi:hypothetical protein AWB69_01743 [Caballeronia udeis]|uniref:HTH araC/xylS-type domain-containing protein n=1 Tax=Caballeronia udeis TaxID=1232866 RepID=A0A158FWG0_9BURK|nr:hypothetical protein [Caballeronia udeis]SAL24198.1 hypothetical protein AWB69_01743 [Caballeronia udeis]